jgi:hypothetical protein
VNRYLKQSLIAAFAGFAVSIATAWPELSKQPALEHTSANRDYVFEGSCGCAVVGRYSFNALFVPIRLVTLPFGKPTGAIACFEKFIHYEDPLGKYPRGDSGRSEAKKFGWPQWAECRTPEIMSSYRQNVYWGGLASVVVFLLLVAAARGREHTMEKSG